jgi:hypothetical protein
MKQQNLFLTLLFISLFITSVGFTASEIPANYDTLTASEKLQVIETMQSETKYSQLPNWTGLEPLSLLSLALPFRGKSRIEYMGVAVNRKSDFMPEDRTKPIHTYGSKAGVRFVVERSLGYTGIFSSGAEYIISTA